MLKKELTEKIASLEDQIAQLRADGEASRSAFQEERDRLLRALAEERNLRNRAAANEQVRLHSLKLSLLSSFLPVLDNFDRALTQQYQDLGSLRHGMEIILRQLSDILAAHGVAEIPSLGEPFHHDLHEAVGTAPDADLPDGTVAAVQRKGFLLDGKLLRPAQVLVAKRPADQEDEGDGPA